MKKKTLIHNSKVYFLLAIFVCQSVLPTVSYGLTGDASQPEFAAYEEFDTTDMVDLITGDFSYNIPLVNVPSPEGGFQVPLSYHAGIELDEESSWVGLGWSLNPGVLDRIVSMYPDDYSDAAVTTNVVNSGGSAYVRNFLVYTEYYDSEKGKGGAVSLGDVHFGWGTKKHIGLSSTGLTYSNGSLKYSIDDMAQSMGTHMNNMISIWGGPAGTALTLAYNGIQTAATISSAQNAVQSERQGNWKFENTIDKKGFFIGRKTGFKYYFDQTTTDKQFGSLYLGGMGRGYVYSGSPHTLSVFNGTLSQPTSADEINTYYVSGEGNMTNIPSSDMYMHYDDGSYASNINPTGIAYDAFSVKSGGVSGGIAPFRHDIGSFSNPVASGTYHNSYALSTFEYPSGQKVSFKYLADPSNSYTYPVIGGNLNNPTFAFTPLYVLNQHSLIINDPKAYVFGHTNYNPAQKTEALRNGLYQDVLVHGRHIQWYSNAEISSTTAKAKGLMESGSFFSRTGLPAEGIGGFTVTREDGLTYHYTIPVYNKSEYTRFDKGNTHCRVYNPNPYATMWLLTGITGSDFIDRGTIGLIDSEDWGYWVQFSYGKFASNYMWRAPYHSFSLSGTDNYSVKKGVKETYYLNKISTRTHTALFAKSYKTDGKSFHDSDGLDAGDGTVTDCSSALKLDDIYILANEDYNTLTTGTGAGGMGLSPTFNSGQGESGLHNNDTYANVLDNFDLAPTTIGNFLKQKQINKYHFNYSYALCNKTWNSFDYNSNGTTPIYNSDDVASVDLSLRKGKLTLLSVDMLGAQNTRVMPGYVFDYGNFNSSNDNPNYDPNKWDDWNMYNPNGTNATTSHAPTSGGDQWSLKKITSPLGSEIEVKYERDSYSSVNGIDIYKTINPTINTQLNCLELIGYVSGLSPGDLITVTAQIQNCQLNSSYPTISNPQILGTRTEVKQITVASIQGNRITAVENLASLFNFTEGFCMLCSFPYNFNRFQSVSPNYNGKKLLAGKFGGGIRVKEVKVKDENGNSYTTMYAYDKSILGQTITSGVCTYEPEHTGGIYYSFYDLQDHPVMPILYSNVTVINGRFEGVFQETNKTTFHFVTPHVNMISYQKNLVGYGQYNSEHWQDGFKDYYNFYNYLSANFNIINKTAMIGNLDTVKSYNTKNHLISKTVYEYTDNSANEYANNMGKYAETTFLYEYMKSLEYENNPGGNSTLFQKTYLFRLLQTNKVKYPNILKSVSTTQNGITSRQEFKEYDYLTGAPTRVLTTYGNQEKYETYTVPAYTKLAEMGSKVYDPKAKNMMVAPAEQYSYVYDQNNTKKLLDASITTWSKAHNYRTYNSSSGSYQNEVTNTAVNLPYLQGNVILPFQTYRWKSIVDEDGTIKNSDYVAYNWSLPTQNPHWIKTSEATLYDRYSRLLESKDINGNRSSVKYGYGSAFETGTQANSAYTGWCYSGAEDKSAAANYFEGEVAGATTQFLSPTFAHTGQYSSRCTSGQTGFLYKGTYGTDFNYTTYRSSVWVHASNAQDAVLYATIKNNGGASITTVQTKLGDPGVTQAGGWYLFNLDLKISSAVTGATTVEFGCKNVVSATTTGGAVYFDDFRVHKVSTPLTANVYDPKTALVTAVLDEENFATKFIYDNAGRITATYKETRQGFKQVSKSEYNYAR